MRDMAEQNKNQSFAGKAQQNEKIEETVQKEKRGRKDQRKKRKQKSLRWMIPIAIGVGLDIFCAVCLYVWSKSIGKSSVYLNFVADGMANVVLIGMESALTIATAVLSSKGEKKLACFLGVSSTVIILIIFGLAGVKVWGSVNEDSESQTAAGMEESRKAFSPAGDQVVYQVQQYILEDDLFIEKLEQYCSMTDREISREERPDIMAELILRYLKSKAVGITEKVLPKNYETNVLLADVLYESFSDLLDESRKPENGSIMDRICDYALKILSDAIDCRIEADHSLHTAENRRMIGVYQIDSGDFFLRVEEIDSATACFEDAAEWAVQSIYSAAVENDLEGMNDAWDVLNNATVKMEEAEGSDDGDRVQKMKNIRDAYRIVIDQWN